MGYKALSTSRTTATTAVSKQATVINSANGFEIGGATITANTTVSLNVNTPGQAPNNVQAGLSISSINYLNANGTISTANAVSTSGGNIKINGAGFSSPMTVIVGGTTVSNANVTVANTSAIVASLGSASPGNVSLYAFNAAGTGAQLVDAVFYSGAPVWTTSAVSFQNGSAANVALVASSDSTLTYTLQAGSTLPTGISLVSTGYLSGTATGYTTNSTDSVVIVATDNEGQATQQTITWTVAVSDPQFNYVSLLLNGDTGTNIVNNANNNVFLDSSTNNVTVTRFDNTTQGTFSPYSQTGWSINYPALAYMTYAANPIGSFGTGATFTVEGWVNMSVNPNTNYFFSLLASCDQGSATYWAIGIGSTGLASVYWYDGNAKTCAGSTALAKGVWYHVAVVVTSGVVKIYVNGVSETLSGTTTLTNPTGNSSYTTGTERGASNGSSGTISNLRTNTGALYSANFTPSTTPLTNVANTTLLTAQSNRYIDNSSSARTITPFTTTPPRIQAYSPFAPAASYTAATYGGGGYFDGTNDYLTVPASSNYSFGSGTFTVEAWVYKISAAIQGIASIQNASNGWTLRVNANNTVQIFYPASSSVTSTGTVTLNAWTHIAAVRVANTVTVYINGVAAGSGSFGAETDSLSTLGIGLERDATNKFSGYMSDLRITKGQSLYTTNFTPPTVPLTSSAGTNLLLNFTNGGIVDAHSTNTLETAGNAKLTTAVTKFGTASIAFDGTGDYLYTPNNVNYQFGTGDYTVEFWLNMTSFSGQNTVVIDFRTANGASGGAIQIFVTSAGIVTVYGGSSTGTLLVTAGSAISTTTWTHIALTRASGATKLFINGTQSGTTYLSDTTSYGLGALWLATTASAGGNYLTGYMDDIRITKGFARYTANFTAPSSPFQGQ